MCTCACHFPQATNVARLRDYFANRRAAERYLRCQRAASATAFTPPPVLGHADEYSPVCELVTVARGVTHTHTVTVPAGHVLLAWSTVVSKSVAVAVAAAGAAVSYATSGEVAMSG